MGRHPIILRLAPGPAPQDLAAFSRLSWAGWDGPVVDAGSFAGGRSQMDSQRPGLCFLCSHSA